MAVTIRASTTCENKSAMIIKMGNDFKPFFLFLTLHDTLHYFSCIEIG